MNSADAFSLLVAGFPRNYAPTTESFRSHPLSENLELAITLVVLCYLLIIPAIAMVLRAHSLIGSIPVELIKYNDNSLIFFDSYSYIGEHNQYTHFDEDCNDGDATYACVSITLAWLIGDRDPIGTGYRIHRSYGFKDWRSKGINTLRVAIDLNPGIHRDPEHLFNGQNYCSDEQIRESKSVLDRYKYILENIPINSTGFLGTNLASYGVKRDANGTFSFFNSHGHRHEPFPEDNKDNTPAVTGSFSSIDDFAWYLYTKARPAQRGFGKNIIYVPCIIDTELDIEDLFEMKLRNPKWADRY